MGVKYRETEISGAEMRRKREAVGLTQEQIAYRIGVSWATVSRCERGIVTPRNIYVREFLRVINEYSRKRNND